MGSEGTRRPALFLALAGLVLAGAAGPGPAAAQELTAGTARGRDGAPALRPVEGRVIYPDGEPAAGAFVQIARERVVCDSAGAFRVELERCWPWAPLVAWHADATPGVVEGLGARVLDGETLPPQTLVLGPPPRNVRGELLDPRGRPLALWSVFVDSDVWVYRNEVQEYGHPEDLAGGRTIDRTDGEGRFELRRLRPQEYPIVCLDPETLFTHRTRLRVGGEDPIDEDPVTVRLPVEPALRRLELELRDPGGRPLPNTRLELILRDRAQVGRVHPIDVGAPYQGRLRVRSVAARGLALQRGDCMFPGCGRVEVPDEVTSAVLVVPDHRH